jgi:hypothetical protein
MKLKFRHQSFNLLTRQRQCAMCSHGQPFHAPTYMIDPGLGQMNLDDAYTLDGL